MIEVTELTKYFGSGENKVIAVDHVSFHVAKGEVFGLLGPNGAGKTTTLRMLLGLIPPSYGDALIDGHSAANNAQAIKQKLGLVSASAGLYQWLTPRETLTYFADLYEVPPDHVEHRVNELAHVLNLTSFLDRRCATLSTGQGQRVNLARVLMHNPPIMMLDEPTRGLDVVGSQMIFEYIDYLRTEGKAVIVSTHRLDEAERLCDRFGLLYRGSMKYMGTMDELRAATGRTHLTDIFVDELTRDVGKTLQLATSNTPDNTERR